MIKAKAYRYEMLICIQHPSFSYSYNLTAIGSIQLRNLHGVTSVIHPTPHEPCKHSAAILQL